jgi:hypothetical protein
VSAPAPPGQRRRGGGLDTLQRLQERAFWLPVAGFCLLSPPLLTIFGGGARLGGIPLLFVYIFATWAALILFGRVMARRLQREDQAPRDSVGAEKAHTDRDVTRDPG